MLQFFQRILNKGSRDESNHFTLIETKNVFLYILGILLYKFGLETYLGSISILAADRFPKENAFTLLGALQGANQACQCLGSILITPIIARYQINRVLSMAISLFCVMALVLLICEAANGGTLSERGQWDIMGLFPIFLLSGVSHGMVELIRRIIPQSICGDSDFKLRKMDSLVHAFHEVIGTVGALFSVFLILIMGSIFANCYVPLIWILSAIVWKKMLLDKPKLSPENERYEPKQECLLVAIFHFFQGFFISIYHGGRIIFSNNRFLWLILGYAFPLVMHRYLESQLAPAFSKHILKITPYSQIMVGGINLGELTGAVFVFLFSYSVHTPLPWVRWNAITLNFLWILPYSYPTEMLDYAWLMALMFFLISSGWAAGDVSLSAYIQSSLSNYQFKNIPSPLSAVMSFLYATYIVIYFCLSCALGSVIDKYVSQNNPREFLFWISGVMMTVTSVLVFFSTFIPIGSFALNPTLKQLGVENDEEEEIEMKDKKENYGEINPSPTVTKKIISQETNRTEEVKKKENYGEIKPSPTVTKKIISQETTHTEEAKKKGEEKVTLIENITLKTV